jgi:hypothetical protein
MEKATTKKAVDLIPIHHAPRSPIAEQQGAAVLLLLVAGVARRYY